MKPQEFKIGQFREVDSSSLRSKENKHNKNSLAHKVQAVGALQVHLKFGERQGNEGHGIHFVIQILNPTNHDVYLYNPLDSLQIKIQDQEGWPVKLPEGRPPRALVNTVDASLVPRAFQVLSITNSSGDSDLSEMADDEFFLIKAGTNYELEIQLPKIQQIKRQDYQAISSKLKTFDHGKYKINIAITLITKENRTEYRMCESGLVEIELINDANS